MKIWTVLLATGLLAINSPATAQDISADRVDLFVALVAQNGCAMNEQLAATVLPENGFTDKNETKQIVGILMGRGDAVLSGNVLTLNTGECGQAESVSPSDRLIAAVRDNNCSMSQQEAETLLPDAGIDMDQVRDLVGPLVSQGVLLIVDGSLQLNQGDCAAAENPNLPRFVAAVIANGCQITKADADTILPAAGIDEAAVDDIVQMLVATGQATFESFDGRSAVVFSDQLCQSGLAVSGADTRTRFLAFMATRGCSIEFEEAKVVLPAAGFDMREIDQLADDLMDEGHASVTGDNQLFTISSEICS